VTELETALGMLGQVWSAVIGWSDWLLRLEMPVWLYEYLDAIFIAVMVVSFGGTLLVYPKGPQGRHVAGRQA